MMSASSEPLSCSTSFLLVDFIALICSSEPMLEIKDTRFFVYGPAHLNKY